MPQLPNPLDRSRITELPVGIQTQILVDAMVMPHPNRCAFSQFCQNWDICNRHRSKPQLDEILRKLRVDVYTPSERVLQLEQLPGGAGQRELHQLEPTEENLGTIETFFAGHSQRKVKCPHFNDGSPPWPDSHGFDNRGCDECGCGPYELTVIQEDFAEWDWAWEENGGNEEQRGWEGGAWTGRLRKNMGYCPGGIRKEREPEGPSPLGLRESVCRAVKAKGVHAYLNDVRHEPRGKLLCREVKRTRAMRPDRLVCFNQRTAKWLGRYTNRTLERRILNGLEGCLTWGEEMIKMLPFIPDFTDRFDSRYCLVGYEHRPPPSRRVAAIRQGLFDCVKKNLEPEGPNHERRFLYKDIRHLMINSAPRFHQEIWEDTEYHSPFGTLPAHNGPHSQVVSANVQAVWERLFFENMLPLYVDYQALTNLETLYLDLQNVPRYTENPTYWQMREVTDLADRLKGKNLKLLVIAGLHTGGNWQHEREMKVEELAGGTDPANPPREWWEVNWFAQFRGALRPGGKLIFVDANDSAFGTIGDEDRHEQWISNRYNQFLAGLEHEVTVGMDGFPLFLDTYYDNFQELGPLGLLPLEDLALTEEQFALAFPQLAHQDEALGLDWWEEYNGESSETSESSEDGVE